MNTASSYASRPVMFTAASSTLRAAQRDGGRSKVANEVGRVIAELPFARVVQIDAAEWAVQVTNRMQPQPSDWRDVYSVRSGVIATKPRIVRSSAEARANYMACMRYASEFQSVFIPLVDRVVATVAGKQGNPSMAEVGAALLDARAELRALERRVSEKWSLRKAYVPFGYVKAEEHWAALAAAAFDIAATRK